MLRVPEKHEYGRLFKTYVSDAMFRILPGEHDALKAHALEREPVLVTLLEPVLSSALDILYHSIQKRANFDPTAIKGTDVAAAVRNVPALFAVGEGAAPTTPTCRVPGTGYQVLRVCTLLVSVTYRAVTDGSARASNLVRCTVRVRVCQAKAKSGKARAKWRETCNIKLGPSNANLSPLLYLRDFTLTHITLK